MNVQEGPRILLVEDEMSLARSLQLEMEHEGYRIDIARNGYEAIDKIPEDKWDLILLDIMLPGINGFDICERIRKHSDVPVIMLTAREATADKVTGLNIGADDYITKPFAMEEFLARVRAQLRRKTAEAQKNNQLTISDLIIHKDSRQAERGGCPIHLSRREFDLLVFLAENSGMVLERESILNHVWGYDFFGDAKVVDVYIRYLRAKIDEPFATPLLQTVRGVGYTLRGEK